MARSTHFAVVDAAPEESADSSGPAACTEIAISGARKTFRRGAMETHALDGVDLTIGASEFVAIVGPSGCGKSTLMRLVSGLLPPSDGQVTIGGHVVKGPQTDLGIVFQKPILLEWRTVLDNVLLQTEMRSMGKAEHDT